MNSIQVPGKVFLMGEYGVIEGGHALLVALRPGFEFRVNGSESATFHPLSPIALYFKKHNFTQSLFLTDPGFGPGFGGSTAELIAGAFAMTRKLPDTKSLWAEYRALCPEASGADLAVQLEALQTKASSFLVKNKNEISPIPNSSLFEQIFLFSVAGDRKLATHEALKGKSGFSVAGLNVHVDELTRILENENEQGLSVFTQFANELSRVGLESTFAADVRSRFQNTPGVLGVKGCGAGLNDVFLVAIKKSEMTQTLKLCHAVATQCELTFWGSLKDHLW